MRKKFIAGNWKMNTTSVTSKDLLSGLVSGLSDEILEKVDVVVCPPFTSLATTNEVIKNKKIGIGAQNIHQKDEGAYTGEISAPMIKSLNCGYVILGHSERRQYFGETNHLINAKIKNALKYGIKPILCVGETLDERENNMHMKIVDDQVTLCLKDLTKEDMKNVIIAYEPVWAIGTGKTATPDMANEMHIIIRQALENIFGKDTADSTRILYGGSMNDKNAAELLAKPDIDGGLIGGAALKADNFIKIIQSAY
ncbi:MAG: triose-phosphate isomerase [Ignavibacteriae bacterium]|nr:triose-phosphate isomerase [Ignavibacteriota bacterium]